jgi:hypothetical protein
LALLALEGRLCPSGGYLFVPSLDTNNVPRYDESTGAFVDEFVRHKSGGLVDATGVVISPHDHNVYVSSGHFASPGQVVGVLRYDGSTGAFLNEFAGRPYLTSPRAMLFGPDGNSDGKLDLYVADGNDDGPGGAVVRFDGITGAFIDYFVSRGSSPLSHPNGMVFGPDGNLYVTSSGTAQVLRYDGTTGAFLGAFIASNSDHVLTTPVTVTFGPDGNLYVADFAPVTGNPAILRYQGLSGPKPGTFLGEFVPAGSGGLLKPLGLLFGPDGNGDGHQDLYVGNQLVGPSFGAKEHSSSVKRYDGVTGAFIDTFVAIGSGGLDNTGFMVFTETDPMTLAYTGGGRVSVGVRSARRSDSLVAAPDLSEVGATEHSAMTAPIAGSPADAIPAAGASAPSPVRFAPQDAALVSSRGEPDRPAPLPRRAAPATDGDDLSTALGDNLLPEDRA